MPGQIADVAEPPVVVDTAVAVAAMDVAGIADTVVVADKVAADDQIVADLFVDVVVAAADVADQLSCSMDHYYCYLHYYRDVPHFLLLHSPAMLNIMVAYLSG